MVDRVSPFLYIDPVLKESLVIPWPAFEGAEGVPLPRRLSRRQARAEVLQAVVVVRSFIESI